jgi:vacuolar-type H+-ATPase subunit E/Vma4
MSEEATRGNEEEIIGKILGDGRARADRVKENARRSADAEKRKAQAEAERIRKESLDRAKRKAAVHRSKEVAGGHVEAKRILLRAREEAISGVFDTIRQELEKIHRDTARYRKSLVRLAGEAVRAIGEPEVEVVIGKEDEDFAVGKLVSDIVEDLGSQGIKGIRIETVVDPGITGGGCVARSTDSRVIFNNTFERRLERMKPSLRSTIVSEVLKRDD